MDLLAPLLALAFVAVLVAVLGAVLRFSVVSPWLTRGATKRLRRPEPEAVAEVCGFPPPPALVELYRTAPFIERGESTLIDGSKNPSARWEIREFLPLTARDVRESRKVSGFKDGITFAVDGDKGAYLALPDGRVVLRSPGVRGGEVLVAETAAAFASFTPG